MSRRLRWLLAILAGLSLLAAACSNSDDDESTDGDDTVADDTDDDADDAGDDTTDDSAADDTDDTDDTGDDTTDDSAADDTGDTGDDVDRTTFVPLEGVPGVTDDEITVAVIGTENGNPLGTCILDCWVTGVQSYFDWQNSLGGVFGRQLVVGDILDDNLLENQQRALEVVAADDALGVTSATLVASGWGDLHEAGIPNYTWSIHAAEANGRDTIYGYTGVQCVTCTARAVPWMAAQVGATRVASLGYGVSENSKVCAQTNQAAFDEYAADIGIEETFLYDELEFGLPSGIAPQVTEWKERGVDFIASCLDLVAMRTIAEELERQDYLDEVTMYHPNSYNADFVTEAGELFDGDYVLVQFVPFEADGGAAQEELQTWVEINGGPVAEQTILGWIAADTFVQGLLAAGPEFDRQSIVDATNSFTEFDAGGLIAPVDWSRQHDAPTEDDRLTNGYEQDCAVVLEMQGGEFVPVGGADTPWLCWPADDRSWSEPTPTSFIG